MTESELLNRACELLTSAEFYIPDSNDLHTDIDVFFSEIKYNERIESEMKNIETLFLKEDESRSN